MSGPLLLTVDQSTSGTKAIVTDGSGCIVARHALRHKQMYPQEGWVEHDPLELYTCVRAAIAGVMREARIDPGAIAALTLTNQRETAVAWDRETGLPVGRAIVWQCRRTAAMCERLKREGHEPLIRAKTGLLLDAYFSATKWRWLLDRETGGVPAERLMLGTVDSWLIWKLSGGKAHKTDYTNASRTLLFNIHTLDWDDELLRLFGIPRAMLPDVCASDEIVAYVDDPELFGRRKPPIAGVIGDSQGALFGQQCVRPGMAKGTYGTGTSLMAHAGSKPPRSEDGLVATVAWGLGGSVSYALEAIVHSTGDSLNWLRDELGLFASNDDLAAAFEATADNGGVYLVPAFVGLGAPHWNPYARAAFAGMSRSTERAHLVRAALESIAFQVADAAALLVRRAGAPLAELRVDGGPTANDRLMQLQADLLAADVVRAGSAELSALGSAYLGGLAVGVWSDPAALEAVYGRERTFRPAMEERERSRLFRGWRAAVAGVLAAERALREEQPG